MNLIKTSILITICLVSVVTFAKETQVIATFPDSKAIQDNSGIVRVDSGFSQNNDGSFGILVQVVTVNSARSGRGVWALSFPLKQGSLVADGDNLYLHLSDRDPVLVGTHRWYYGRMWKPVDNVRITVHKAIDFEEASFSTALEL